MTVLITRPLESAKLLETKIKHLGYKVLLEPLLEIQRNHTIVIPEDQVQAYLLTSRHAAFALAPLPKKTTRILVVGPKTRAAVQKKGFTQIIEAEGHTASLLEKVKEHLKPPNGKLIHVSGAVVREDLVTSLQQEGYDISRVIVYEARPVESLSAATRFALQEKTIRTILFFSPRTVEVFITLTAGLQISFEHMQAICLSPAIATLASPLQWKNLHVASHATGEAMIDCLAHAHPSNLFKYKVS